MVVGSLAVSIVAKTQKFEKALARTRRTVRRFAGALSTVGIAAGAVGAVTFKLANTYNELQRSMNASLAIMSNVSKTMREDMTKAAIEVAGKTRFSAAQAAEAYYFLASAGMNSEQALAAMPKVAAFAQAGNFDLALATDLATDAQSALGMTSKDAQENLANLSRVTDTLIKANTLANASAQQFSEALTNKAGAALRLVNKDIEEGLAVLAAYADQGIKGAEAGTALGIVMRDLQTKALKHASAFKQNGIAVYDASGKMRGLPDILSDIEKRLDGMSDAQKKATLLAVGFSDKSVAYIQTLLGTSDKIRGYEEALRSASGITEKVAGEQMTAMDKAMAKMGEAWTKLSVQMGPSVEMLANWVTALFDADKSTSSVTSKTGALATTLWLIEKAGLAIKAVFNGLRWVITETLKNTATQIRMVLEMIEKIPGVKDAGSQYIKSFEDGFRQVNKAAGDEFLGAGKQLIGMGGKKGSPKAAPAATPQPPAAVTKPAKDALDQGADLARKATQGLSSLFGKVTSAMAKGKEVAEKAVHETRRRSMDKLREDANRLHESLKTDAQRMRARVEKIQTMRFAGVLSRQDQIAAIQQMKKGLGQGPEAGRLTGALREGTAEARAAAMRTNDMRNKGPVAETAKNTAKMREYLEGILETLQGEGKPSGAGMETREF